MFVEKIKNILKYQNKIFSIPLLLGSVLMISVISGCDDLDDDPIPLPDIAYVGLYHASPDAPSLDIVMEQGRINYYPLRYSEYTDYLNFYAGERTMRVSPVNASNVVLDTTFTFETGAAYTLFYVNEYDNMQALLVEDEEVSLAASEAAVRFIHLSPDSPEVNVNRSMGDASSVLVDGSGYLDVTDFTVVESGVQSFRVNLSDSGEEVLYIPDVNLVPGGVYTIVARGFSSPPSGNENDLSANILINN